MVSNRNGLTAKLCRPKPIIRMDCSLEICLWKETGMMNFALRAESIELSHSFVLARCLQVARFFVSNTRWLQTGKVLECTSSSLLLLKLGNCYRSNTPSKVRLILREIRSAESLRYKVLTAMNRIHWHVVRIMHVHVYEYGFMHPHD